MKKCLLLCLFGFVLFYRVQPVKAQEAIAADSLNVPEKTVRLMYEAKPARYITGAVSHISGDEVANVPGVNRLNALAGRMTGIYFYDVDGLPGVENSAVKIRGEHTFGANRSPLVLIDGRLDDYTLVDPYDVESVVFLKDAASLAMYGLRAANGIILINTKRGQRGKAVVNVNHITSLSQPTRLPKYLDAYHYAELYNEAQYNDDPTSTPRYDYEHLDGYKYGDYPQLYPNVNWTDEFLKKYYWLTRTNVNISGGTDIARYYVSGGYTYNSGVFNVDKDLNTYNTNTNAKVMNIHANLQLNIGKNLLIGADIRGKKDIRNLPGSYDTDIGRSMLNVLYSRPFNAHPIKNEDAIFTGDDGKEIDFSLAGTNDYQNNPYGLLNLRGYSILERSSISTYLNVSYSLGDLLKGLSVESRFGFNTYTDYSISRNKSFAVYEYKGQNSVTGDKIYDQFGTQGTALGNGGDYRAIYRNYDHYIGLRYSGDFDRHHVDALLIYDRQQVANVRTADFTKNFQGPKGSVSYRFNDKYLAGFVFSYQGSEQYPKSDRYGFFPAVSAGWVISEESFTDNAVWMDFLKIRGSYGLTGNHVNTYFSYLETYGGGGGYTFGTTPTGAGGYTQTRVANNAITWEKCLTANAGVDFALLGRRLSGSFDYFTENNRDILVQDAITSMYGATGVYAPVGKFENKGYEIELKWNDRIGNVRYYIGANYYVAENKIVFQDEQLRDYPWMYRTGQPVGSRFGLVFDRFFTDSEDISFLPNQSLQGSQQKPGDLKYQDLNDDGVIDDNDIRRIGNSAMPTANYGISFGVQTKGFDVNVLFHGARGGTTYCSNVTYWDFVNRTGNVMEHHLKRWQPGDEQRAGYPRLSLTNENNYVYNSYWLRDNSFFRLKYIEIGYTLPVHISQKAGMSKARIFLNGNNLLVWDKIGVMDPELRDDGLAFPVQRTVSVGLNISF